MATQQMDLSPICMDYLDFRWPQGVEVFAAAHPFDDVAPEQLSADLQTQTTPLISNPAVAFPIPTAPGQLQLNLEFGKSYLYVVHFMFHSMARPLVVLNCSLQFIDRSKICTSFQPQHSC
jgi:hypothetical protein